MELRTSGSKHHWRKLCPHLAWEGRQSRPVSTSKMHSPEAAFDQLPRDPSRRTSHRPLRRHLRRDSTLSIARWRTQNVQTSSWFLIQNCDNDININVYKLCVLNEVNGLAKVVQNDKQMIRYYSDYYHYHWSDDRNVVNRLKRASTDQPPSSFLYYSRS